MLFVARVLSGTALINKLAAVFQVILKPAEATPLTALALAELGRRAGLPPGVLNIVVGEAKKIGKLPSSCSAARCCVLYNMLLLVWAVSQAQHVADLSLVAQFPHLDSRSESNIVNQMLSMQRDKQAAVSPS